MGANQKNRDYKTPIGFRSAGASPIGQGQSRVVKNLENPF